MLDRSRQVTMEIETDPVELAKARAQDERFAKNYAWLQDHVADVYADRNRGKCICIAGQQLFVAEDALTAVALAAAVHPEDDGQLVRYIPIGKGPRIYAGQRPMGSV